MRNDIKNVETATSAPEWSATKTAFFNQIKFSKETPATLKDSTAYYLNKFDLYEKGERKLGWNWVAFFWGPSWGAYRGLFVFLFITIAFVMMCELAEIIYPSTLATAGNSLAAGDFLSILLGVFYLGFVIYVGRQGNLLYVKNILERIKKGSPPRPPKVRDFIGAGLVLGFVMKAFPELIHYLSKNF